MNKIIYVSFLCLLLGSCSMEEEEKDPNLLSEWKLIETYQQDQDKYQPTDRKESIHFYADSNVKKSSPWCTKHNSSVANYSEIDNVISVACEQEPVNLHYEIKGNLLFIYSNSTETSVLKYKKIG